MLFACLLAVMVGGLLQGDAGYCPTADVLAPTLRASIGGRIVSG